MRQIKERLPLVYFDKHLLPKVGDRVVSTDGLTDSRDYGTVTKISKGGHTIHVQIGRYTAGRTCAFRFHKSRAKDGAFVYNCGMFPDVLAMEV